MRKEQNAPQTKFQVYGDFDAKDSKIVDFTEYKLLFLVKSATDQKKRISSLSLLTDYKAGKIAVAWRNGQPIFAVIRKG